MEIFRKHLAKRTGGHKMKTALPIFLFVSCCLMGKAYGFTCPQTPPPQTDCSNPEFQSCGIMVNGINRHFCIHVPSTVTSGNISSLPVVMAFHGNGGNATRQVSIWEDYTEQEMVIVAPSALVSMNRGECVPHWRHIGDGHNLTWGDLADPDPCAGPGAPSISSRFPLPPHQTGGDMSDDLLFVRRLVDAVDNDPDLVPSGYYATGFSNGAGLVYQLFITRGFADRFAGFATVSNGITEAKIAAQAASGGAGFTANHGIKKPFLFIMGTADKANSPAANIIDSVDQLIANGRCTVASVSDAVSCWINHATYPGELQMTMVTPQRQTIEWLVDYNNSVKRDRESLYFGRGQNATDRTLTVRQDFVKKAGTNDSEPVAALTILGGTHRWPRSLGSYPPCGGTSCDVQGTEAILEFWRANAGFPSPASP